MLKDYDKSSYFKLDDINNEDQLNVLPETLLLFLKSLVSKRATSDRSSALAFLGQSLMHLVSNHHLPPLLVCIGTQIHSKTGSQIIIDQLSKYGVSASSTQVREFEVCSAVHKTLFPDSDGLELKCPLYSADNADIYIASLTGEGAWHGMGMIFSHISRQPFSSTPIIRRKVCKSELLERCVKIKFFPKDKDKKLKGLVLETEIDLEPLLNLPCAPIDYIRVSHALCNPEKLVPQQSGAMNIITRANSVPGKHVIEFLPLIDLPSTDINCMLSTLEFISDHHRTLQLPGRPIIGFDQPLWQLATIVTDQMSLDVVLMIGNFHTQGSFLGVKGYIMTNTGLLNALSTVFGEKSVKKMFLGKSYERAMRAHGLVGSVLKKMLIQKVEDDDMYAIEAASELYGGLEEDSEAPFDYTSLNDSPIVCNLLDVIKKVSLTLRVYLPVLSKTLQTQCSHEVCKLDHLV